MRPGEWSSKHRIDIYIYIVSMANETLLRPHTEIHSSLNYEKCAPESSIETYNSKWSDSMAKKLISQIRIVTYTYIYI